MTAIECDVLQRWKAYCDNSEVAKFDEFVALLSSKSASGAPVLTWTEKLDAIDRRNTGGCGDYGDYCRLERWRHYLQQIVVDSISADEWRSDFAAIARRIDAEVLEAARRDDLAFRAQLAAYREEMGTTGDQERQKDVDEYE